MAKTEKAKIGEGDVLIELGDDKITLTPTPYALKMLSRQGGGIPGMVQRCLNYEFDSIMLVIQIGGNLNARQMERYDVETKVFRYGMNRIAPLVIRYLGTLSNGGKPLPDGDEEESDGADRADREEEEAGPLGG